MIAGCSGESDDDLAQEEGLEEEEQEEEEQEEEEQEGDSQSTIDLDGFVPDPPGYLNTTFFNEIHSDGYSIYESPVTGSNFVGGFGETFSEINHKLGIGYAITRNNGVIEVFPSIEAAEKRIELVKQSFAGSNLSIEGWEDWHLVEDVSGWDQVLDWNRESDREYPLLLEVTDESKQHAVIQINNIILTVGVVNDEFSDPHSVLVDSIESRSNEFGSAGVPEGLLELGHIYSTTDLNFSEPDPDEVAARDYFAVPLEEFSEDNVREIMTNRIATHGEGFQFNVNTETGNYGQRDVSTSFSTETPYRVGSPQFSFVGDSIDRFPGPWHPTLTEENQHRVSVVYNAYDTVETAISEYQNWIDYIRQRVRPNEERTSMIITTGSGYDEQGFYVEEFVGQLRNNDGQVRLNGNRFLLRRTYLSGNTTVQISHMINLFDYV